MQFCKYWAFPLVHNIVIYKVVGYGQPHLTDSWCGIKLQAGISPLDSGNLLPAARLGSQSQSKSQESDYLMMIIGWMATTHWITLPCYSHKDNKSSIFTTSFQDCTNHVSHHTFEMSYIQEARKVTSSILRLLTHTVCALYTGGYLSLIDN